LQVLSLQTKPGLLLNKKKALDIRGKTSSLPSLLVLTTVFKSDAIGWRDEQWKSKRNKT